jgi:hypothetical protein
MGGVAPILNGIRRIIAHHIVGDIPVLSPIATGDTIIHLKTTLRLKTGHELILTNGDDAEPGLFIKSVIDNTSIELTSPVKFNWGTSSFAKIGFNGNFIKAIYLGEPDVIPAYPAITVNIKTSHSEFWTMRATKERYELEVGVFVEDATQEAGAILLWDLTDKIQLGLKKNVYPLVSDYKTYPITADIADNDLYIKVADSSVFTRGCMIIVEDTFKTQEFILDNICDSTTIKLQSPVNGDFFTEDTNLIVPARFIYNSWPADITFGKIFKGTLLKGAAISWFGEEMEIQFNQPWSDTQLT